MVRRFTPKIKFPTAVGMPLLHVYSDERDRLPKDRRELPYTFNLYNQTSKGVFVIIIKQTKLTIKYKINAQVIKANELKI